MCRLIEGVFESRPAVPKYVDTWDVDTVIAKLDQWPDTDKLSLMKLTLRTYVASTTFCSVLPNDLQIVGGRH